MEVPRSIMDRYRNVTLSADIMHINGISFFVAISRQIKHVSIIPIRKRNHETMLSCVDKVKAAYEHRGFNEELNVDGDVVKRQEYHVGDANDNDT